MTDPKEIVADLGAVILVKGRCAVSIKRPEAKEAWVIFADDLKIPWPEGRTLPEALQEFYHPANEELAKKQPGP